MLLFSFQGVDLRHYSKQVETELLDVENASIQDCILCGTTWHRFNQFIGHDYCLVPCFVVLQRLYNWAHLINSPSIWAVPSSLRLMHVFLVGFLRRDCYLADALCRGHWPSTAGHAWQHWYLGFQTKCLYMRHVCACTLVVTSFSCPTLAWKKGTNHDSFVFVEGNRVDRYQTFDFKRITSLWHLSQQFWPLTSVYQISKRVRILPVYTSR